MSNEVAKRETIAGLVSAEVLMGQIAKIATVGTAKTLEAKSSALHDYLKKEGASRELLVGYAIARCEAAARGGEILTVMAGSGERQGRGRKQIGHDVPFTPTVTDLGFHPRQASRWQQAGRVDPEARQAYYAGTRAQPTKDVTLEGLCKLGREPREPVVREIDCDPPQVWCESWDKWLPNQPDCDLLVTDPPYMTDVEDVAEFAAGWLPVALGKVKPTGMAYVCVGAYPAELHAYLAVSPPDHLDLDNVLVWTYRNTMGPKVINSHFLNWQAILYYRGVDAGPLQFDRFKKSLDAQCAVQDFPHPCRSDHRFHEWQKPDGLGDWIAKQATGVGDVVLDPFCCTATFLLAAAKHGCIARGCDINRDNIDLAIKRGCVDE